MNKIITIYGTTGAGKTEIGNKLAERIQSTKFISFDDYDGKVVFPKNYPASMPEEYDISELFNFIKDQKKESTIIFDYPFGRANRTMNQIIDFAVFLNVPLDISMARRIKREFMYNSSADHSWLLSQIDSWENGTRDFIIKWEKMISDTCDFVIDNIDKPETVIDRIIEKLKLN